MSSSILSQVPYGAQVPFGDVLSNKVAAVNFALTAGFVALQPAFKDLVHAFLETEVASISTIAHSAGLAVIGAAAAIFSSNKPDPTFIYKPPTPTTESFESSTGHGPLFGVMVCATFSAIGAAIALSSRSGPPERSPSPSTNDDRDMPDGEIPGSSSGSSGEGSGPPGDSFNYDTQSEDTDPDEVQVDNMGGSGPPPPPPPPSSNATDAKDEGDGNSEDMVDSLSFLLAAGQAVTSKAIPRYRMTSTTAPGPKKTKSALVQRSNSTVNAGLDDLAQYFAMLPPPSVTPAPIEGNINRGLNKAYKYPVCPIVPPVATSSICPAAVLAPVPGTRHALTTAPMVHQTHYWKLAIATGLFAFIYPVASGVAHVAAIYGEDQGASKDSKVKNVKASTSTAGQQLEASDVVVIDQVHKQANMEKAEIQGCEEADLYRVFSLLIEEGIFPKEIASAARVEEVDFEIPTEAEQYEAILSLLLLISALAAGREEEVVAVRGEVKAEVADLGDVEGGVTEFGGHAVELEVVEDSEVERYGRILAFLAFLSTFNAPEVKAEAGIEIVEDSDDVERYENVLAFLSTIDASEAQVEAETEIVDDADLYEDILAFLSTFDVPEVKANANAEIVDDSDDAELYENILVFLSTIDVSEVKAETETMVVQEEAEAEIVYVEEGVGNVSMIEVELKFVEDSDDAERYEGILAFLSTIDVLKVVAVTEVGVVSEDEVEVLEGGDAGRYEYILAFLSTFDQAEIEIIEDSDDTERYEDILAFLFTIDEVEIAAATEVGVVSEIEVELEIVEDADDAERYEDILAFLSTINAPEVRVEAGILNQAEPVDLEVEEVNKGVNKAEEFDVEILGGENHTVDNQGIGFGEQISAGVVEAGVEVVGVGVAMTEASEAPTEIVKVDSHEVIHVEASGIEDTENSIVIVETLAVVECVVPQSEICELEDGEVAVEVAAEQTGVESVETRGITEMLVGINVELHVNASTRDHENIIKILEHTPEEDVVEEFENEFANTASVVEVGDVAIEDVEVSSVEDGTLGSVEVAGIRNVVGDIVQGKSKYQTLSKMGHVPQEVKGWCEKEFSSTVAKEGRGNGRDIPEKVEDHPFKNVTNVVTKTLDRGMSVSTGARMKIQSSSAKSGLNPQAALFDPNFRPRVLRKEDIHSLFQRVVQCDIDPTPQPIAVYSTSSYRKPVRRNKRW